LASEPNIPVTLTSRQQTEAEVYNARARAAIESLSDEELRVDPHEPPFPNREHLDTMGFILRRP
jgi:hypothetical protein